MFLCEFIYVSFMFIGMSCDMRTRAETQTGALRWLCYITICHVWFNSPDTHKKTNIDINIRDHMKL